MNKLQAVLTNDMVRYSAGRTMQHPARSGKHRGSGTRSIQWVRPLEFLVIFLPTLQSYYFYNLGLAPFPAIALLLIVFLCALKGSTATRTDVTYAVGVLALFGASCLWGAMRNPTGISVKNIVGTVMGPCFALGLVSYFRHRTSALKTYLQVTLIVHVVAITVQYIAYYGFGFYLDLLAPITGEPQRYVGTGLITGISRATGLFNEPAVYALFVITLLFLLTRFRGALSPLHIVALVTVLFNFSLLGLGLLVVFLSTYWLSSNVRMWAKVLSL